METFAQRLKRLRETKKLSQRGLAELAGGKKLGFHQQVIALLENGSDRRMSRAQWSALAVALDVSPAYLAFSSESEKVKNPEQDDDTAAPQKVAA